jgi:hypothetical protein
MSTFTMRDATRDRARRLAIAAAVGASIVLWLAFPGPRQVLAQQPPPFERALRWRDIIRLRLPPWLRAEPDEAGN